MKNGKREEPRRKGEAGYGHCEGIQEGGREERKTEGQRRNGQGRKEGQRQEDRRTETERPQAGWTGGSRGPGQVTGSIVPSTCLC